VVRCGGLVGGARLPRPHRPLRAGKMHPFTPSPPAPTRHSGTFKYAKFGRARSRHDPARGFSFFRGFLFAPTRPPPPAIKLLCSTPLLHQDRLGIDHKRLTQAWYRVVVFVFLCHSIFSVYIGVSSMRLKHPSTRGFSETLRRSHDPEPAALVLVVARGRPVVDGAIDHVVHEPRALPAREPRLEALAESVHGGLRETESRAVVAPACQTSPTRPESRCGLNPHGRPPRRGTRCA